MLVYEVSVCLTCSSYIGVSYAQTTNNTNTSRVGDGSCKGSTGCPRHTGKDNGVLDAQQFRERRLEGRR
jgi:hypothetical protein